MLYTLMLINTLLNIESVIMKNAPDTPIKQRRFSFKVLNVSDTHS